MTGAYRRPAHQKCKSNVTPKLSTFIAIALHNFSNYDCRPNFKNLFGKKNDKVKSDILPKTNEEYITVTCGCIKFIDSYRFLSSSLDSLVIKLVVNNQKTLENSKKEILDYDEILNIVIEKEILIGKT